MNPYCNFEGIDFIPWAPLTGGAPARLLSLQTPTIGGEENTRQQLASAVDKKNNQSSRRTCQEKTMDNGTSHQYLGILEGVQSN